MCITLCSSHIVSVVITAILVFVVYFVKETTMNQKHTAIYICLFVGYLLFELGCALVSFAETNLSLRFLFL